MAEVAFRDSRRRISALAKDHRVRAAITPCVVIA
jgi:hypothetical protein